MKNTLPEALFKTIDVLLDGGQNKNKMTKFKDVNFEIETEVNYDPAFTDCCNLDICYVKQQNQEKYPVFFYIHGGGFVGGDKKHRRGVSKFVAEKGYFTVNVNHGLAPKYKFPQGLIHLVKALNWVGENAEKYNLDLDKMVVSGDSAGGYYSALLSEVSCSEELQKKIGVTVNNNLRFRGAVLDCGVYDVELALTKKLPLDMVGKIARDFADIKVSEFDNYEWKFLSAPSKLVTKDFPKTHICYSKKDIFCAAQGEFMIEQLKANDVYVECHNTTNFMNNHCYPLLWSHSDKAKEYWSQVSEFLLKIKNGEL